MCYYVITLIYLSSLSILKIVAVCHVRLLKIHTLTLRQVLGTNMHHRTKFCKDHVKPLRRYANYCDVQHGNPHHLRFPEKLKTLMVDPL